MPTATRPLALLAVLSALGTLSVADAQKATPPTPPKAPTKPVSTLKPTEAAAEGGITLICRDFAFGETSPAKGSGNLFGSGQTSATPYRDSQITYESVTVKDTSGAAHTIYAPTRIVITHEFKPSPVAITSTGRNLSSGDCGTPNAVITGLKGPAKLVFNNFPSVTMQTGRKSANDAGMQASVNLPPCPSGLRSFRTMRQNTSEFVIVSAADAACLAPN